MCVGTFPERVTIELTNDCNFSCPMCPRQYMRDSIGYMNGDLWQRVIDQCASRGAVIVPFWRGESLLHPDFGKMIKYALGRVAEVQFATNGQFINEENAPLLNQLDFVSVSIHHWTAIEKLKILLRYRKTGKPNIQVSFVESEKNLELMERVRGMVDCVRVYKDHTLNGVFGKADVQPSSERDLCPRLLSDLVIAYDGSISRCCYVWKTDQTLNVITQSISEIWNSPFYREVLDHYPDAVCRPCDQWRGETLGERYSSSVE